MFYEKILLPKVQNYLINFLLSILVLELTIQWSNNSILKSKSVDPQHLSMLTKIIIKITSEVTTGINAKMDTVRIKKLLKIKWLEQMSIKIHININLDQNQSHLQSNPNKLFANRYLFNLRSLISSQGKLDTIITIKFLYPNFYLLLLIFKRRNIQEKQMDLLKLMLLLLIRDLSVNIMKIGLQLS